jgi:hypothetical protein
MYLKIEICLPFSLTEIFDRSRSGRLSELRATALEAFNGNRKAAWHYISKPRSGWGKGMDEASLFDQSYASSEQHQRAMDAIGRMQYGIYS